MTCCRGKLKEKLVKGIYTNIHTCVISTAPHTYGSTTLLHSQGTTISDHTNTTQTRQSRDIKDTTRPIQINTRMNEND